MENVAGKGSILGSVSRSLKTVSITFASFYTTIFQFGCKRVFLKKFF